MTSMTFSLLLILFIKSCPYIHCDNSGQDSENGNDVDDDVTHDVITEDSVIVLNSQNFYEVVQKNHTLLVELYVPCHVPEYSAVAEELAKHDQPIQLAKIDITQHRYIVKRFKVTGCNTLMFFKNGKSYEYDGPREKDGIVEYMKKIADPKWKPRPEAVITLTKDNFDEVANKEQLMIVMFYAPWSGQYRVFYPVFEKAAKELQKMELPVLMAKVDRTVEIELVEKYGITYYPHYKVFRYGRPSDVFLKNLSHYEEIVSFVKLQFGDGAKEITDSTQLKEFLSTDDISVVGFFQSHDDPKVAAYRALSNDMRNDFNFGIVFNKEIRVLEYGLNPNSVVVFTAKLMYTKYEPTWYVLEIQDNTAPVDILTFILKHKLPLVGQYVYPYTRDYDEIRPLLMLFYSVPFSFDHKEAIQFWRHKIADVANRFQDITFAVAEDFKYDTTLKSGCRGSQKEIDICLLGSDGKSYAMEPIDEYDSDDIIEFLTNYKNGKLKPYIKSQKAPIEQTGHVTVVVGETFDEIVKDTSKDVLIELYAPSWGECKQLESKYEELAQKLKSESNLVIAKIDTTENYVPETYSKKELPRIYFVASNNKESPLLYDGTREIEEFEKFLRQHATVSFGKNMKEEL